MPQGQTGGHQELSDLGDLSLRVQCPVDAQSSEGRVAHRSRLAKPWRSVKQRHKRPLQMRLPIT